MKITGKRTFTVSQLERFELLVVQTALNDFYKRELDSENSFHGETALRLLNRIDHHMSFNQCDG
jgi:hypothetical protein